MPNPPKNLEEPETTGFLQRWSERKANAAAEPTQDTIETNSEITEPAEPVAVDEAASTSPADAPPEITEADLENLTFDSDYTKFMGEHVPEALRRRALRQLWRSDPVLANIDGLCDYDDDFTDAALAVKVLQTAHKVGQGFLTDEDLAANRARGEPKTTQSDDTENSQHMTSELEDDEGEDIEDFDDVAQATDQAESATVKSPDSGTENAEPKPDEQVIGEVGKSTSDPTTRDT